MLCLIDQNLVCVDLSQMVCRGL